MDLSGQTVGIVTAMKTDLRTAAAELERLLAAESLTAGMLVRAHGAHLIVGRDDNEDERDAGRIDDRVRLTRLDAATWGLSVKRHNGRWERTPFTGTIAELVDVMLTFMQHLVAS